MLVVVAGRITAAFHIQFVATAFLCIVTGDVTFTLLAHHVTDNSFLALKIIADGIGFIRGLAILEHRLALDDAQRIFHTVGIDRAAVQVHGNDFCRKFYILMGIVHFTFAIQMGIAVLGKDQRVVCLVSNGSIQPFILLGFHGVLRQSSVS